MNTIITLIIALIIIVVLFKVAKGIIRTFGLVIVALAVLAVTYFSGGFG